MTTPHFPIYLDYSSTNPCDPRVVDAIVPWLREHFGNPASRSHAWGWEAEAAVEKAREQVADLIGADPREIVWTSGATESKNSTILELREAHRSCVMQRPSPPLQFSLPPQWVASMGSSTDKMMSATVISDAFLAKV